MPKPPSPCNAGYYQVKCIPKSCPSIKPIKKDSFLRVLQEAILSLYAKSNTKKNSCQHAFTHFRQTTNTKFSALCYRHNSNGTNHSFSTFGQMPKSKLICFLKSAKCRFKSSYVFFFRQKSVLKNQSFSSFGKNPKGENQVFS